MIDFETLIKTNYPKFAQNYPNSVVNFAIGALKRLFHQDEINKFWKAHENEKNDKFIEEIFKYLNFTYKIDNVSLQNIPETGRVIFVANHPIGGLDGLSLVHQIYTVRKDVKILANQFLQELEPIKELFIGIDNLSNKNSKESIRTITQFLEDEHAIIIFPAGEVSRAGWEGVKDSKWKDGFLKFAKRTESPVVPVFVDGKNSFLFYFTSVINKPLSGLLLGRELFNKRNKSIEIKIGEMIPYENLKLDDFRNDDIANLVKEHLYRIAKGKNGVFKTRQCLIKSQNRDEISAEILAGEKIGETRDKKGIYICKTPKTSPLLLEIGRLRELSFRAVGEGTGSACDIDEFDHYYHHLVLFDEGAKEIVGAYRIGNSDEIRPDFASEKLYTQTLFDFHQEAEFLFHNSIELGRSFVVPKFWGTKALDYLWYGLGAYIVKNPNIRYLFGPVSISVSYPKPARDLLVYFYKKYFAPKDEIVISRNRYYIGLKEMRALEEKFNGANFEEDFTILKNSLAFYGLFVPTLYKQYSDLCVEDGVKFLDFGIDPDFDDCTDGFLVVDVEKIKQEKKDRYFKVHKNG